MASGLTEGRCRILALHSAGDGAVALLAAQGQVVAGRRIEGNRAAIRLTAAVQELLTETGWRPGDLDRIAVCTGPGSFTGIKVGLATALGLSLAAGVPIVGVGSLEVLAVQAPGSVEVTVLLPAGRSELYVARFGPSQGPSSPQRPGLEPASLVAPARLLPALDGRTVLHLGCGPLLESVQTACTLLEADAGRLAHDLALLGALRHPQPLGRIPPPLYLRRTWAEEARDRKAGATG